MSQPEPVQPYAAAYLAAHPDREWRGHEFIVWISGQWQAWADETGADLSRPVAERSGPFRAWLSERWGVSA